MYADVGFYRAAEVDHMAARCADKKRTNTLTLKLVERELM